MTAAERALLAQMIPRCQIRALGARIGRSYAHLTDIIHRGRRKAGLRLAALLSAVTRGVVAAEAIHGGAPLPRGVLWYADGMTAEELATNAAPRIMLEPDDPRRHIVVKQFRDLVEAWA